ncbi:hypothetical protein O3Q52_27965 [Streptomyces sp. ActVer]|uniref:hypothetical protein n=1 Tax=Streptomyces sp. ActVer TaxID=3014558 RepID=UPI0022B39F2F|nr:hypothetical protein [Streptomyces sp. ActVer]MCZ4511945.1 hypothetical protein [Streptomyces sp. ActVer]
MAPAARRVPQARELRKECSKSLSIARQYQRIGTATVTGQVTVPLYEYEIDDLELHLTVLLQQRAPHDQVEAARRLLGRLHALQGRARAMQTLNGIPVTRPAIAKPGVLLNPPAVIAHRRDTAP